MNKRADILATATRLAVDGATLDEAAQTLEFLSGDALRAFLLEHRYIATARALSQNTGLPPANTLTDFDRLVRGEGETNGRRRPRHSKS